MRHIALGLAAAVFALMAGNAFADGMPTRYGPAACCAFSWTGFYFGANVGGAWQNDDATGFVPATSDMNGAARALEAAIDNGGVHGSGFMGGLQGGYNVQRGNIVLGLETDFNWLDLHASRNTGLVTVGGFTGETLDKVSEDWLFTLRPRVGVTYDRALFYATGGLAVTQSSFSHRQSWNFADGCPTAANGQEFCHVGSTSDTNATWTVGGGLEYALSNTWSVKGEYLYVATQDLSFTSQNAGFTGQPVIHSADLGGVNIFRIGINYKFGSDCCAAPLK